MNAVKLFKEVKRGDKKIRENSYFNGKKRVFYEYVIIEESKLESYTKKGFNKGLPTGVDKVAPKATQVKADANTDSKDSDPQTGA